MKRDLVDPDLPQSMLDEFAQLLKNMSNEATCVKELENLISTYGKEQFLKLYKNTIINIPHKSFDEIIYKGKLLHYAVSKQQTNLVKLLVETGVDINEDITSNDEDIESINPLIIAIKNSNLKIIDYLIDHGVDILEIGRADKSILMYSKNPNVWTLILKKAEEQQCLTELLYFVDANENSPIAYAIHHARFDLLQTIFSMPNWKKNLNIIVASHALHFARLSSWVKPDSYKEYNHVCLLLRDYFKNHETNRLGKEIISMKDTTVMDADINKSHQSLFGHQYTTTILDSEEKALLNIMPAIDKLFKSPHRCMKYLKFLNKEFDRYLKETYGKLIENVDPAHYSFRLINNVYYPIPNYDFVGQSKKNALDKFLITLMNQNGLGAVVNHWVGFVPHEVANKTVTEGNYVKENIFTPNGLLHGALAHMLQQAILIYAIQNGEINTNYYDNDEIKHVPMKKILEKLVEINPFTNTSFWEFTRDRRKFEVISFSDPYRFVSVIMHEGMEYNLNSLANSLIDSFCKNFLKLFKAHLSTGPNANMNRYEFAMELNDLEMNRFFIPESLRQYALNYAAGKNKINTALTLGEKEDDYAVLFKQYSIDNPNFIPANYQDPNIANMPKPIISTLQLIHETIKKEMPMSLAYAFDTNTLLLHACYNMEKNADTSNQDIFKFNDIISFSIKEMVLIDGSNESDSLLLILCSLLKNADAVVSLLFSDSLKSKQYSLPLLVTALNGMLGDAINVNCLLSSYDEKETLTYNIFKYHLNNHFSNNTSTSLEVSALLKFIQENPEKVKWTNNTLALLKDNKMLLVKDICTKMDLDLALSIFSNKNTLVNKA